MGVSHRDTSQRVGDKNLALDLLEKTQARLLPQSEEHYRTIFENANDAIAFIALDGTITSVNRSAERLTGLLREQIIGRPYTQFLAPASHALGKERLQRALAGKHLPSIFEIELVRANGHTIAVEARTRFLRDHDGTLTGFLGIYRDITDRKRTEEALRQVQAELEHRVQERTAALAQANNALLAEIAERKRAEGALQNAHRELDKRVQERTAALTQANGALQAEIEERKRVETALRESEEQYRDLFENANDVIGTGTLENIITSANRRVEQMLGYSREEFVGKYFLDFATPKSRALIEERTRRRLAGEEVSSTVELELVHRDNSIVIVEGIVRTHRDPDGKPIGVHAIYRDITARKDIERVKDELISTVSHELRTPLASLRGFAELMLQRDFPPEKQRELLTIIHTEAIRLSRLIDDFLDLHRIESGHQPYTFACLMLEPLLRESAELFANLEEPHPLRLAIAPALLPVRGDVNRLRQVLVNLISNAIKFSLRKEEIEVGARTEGHQVVVWVTDHGVGIPLEAVPKLFTKFFRVDNSDTRHIGGTGLGLALVREIIHAHQGKVWVESTVGGGSTFFFTLPHASLDL